MLGENARLVVETTSAHHNTHLSMSLKRTGFADRDAIPRVPWVLACAFADVTRWRCGQNGTAEDPGTVRQRVECLDLTSFRRNPECFWRHLKKPRGIVEVKPRFDSDQPACRRRYRDRSAAR